MLYKKNLVDFIKCYLPPMSEIAVIKKSYEIPAVCITDLDGDGVTEIAAVYKWQGQLYLIILKFINNMWYVAANRKGEGYDITCLNAAPVIDKNHKNLIIGWQVDSIWSKLCIVDCKNRSLNNIIKDNMYYSRIEVEYFRDENDGKAKIALWKHISGDAYKINIYKWNGYKLVPAEDVSPYYFKKITVYYKDKIKETPDSPMLWYCLAQAQLKSGMMKKALKSLDILSKFNSISPSKEEISKLKQEALSKLELEQPSKDTIDITTDVKNDTLPKSKNYELPPLTSDIISLYPASVKKIDGITWGYINEKGEFVITPKYQSADSFQKNGLANVQINNLFGIIDKTGKYIVKPKYNSINRFSEGRASVSDSSGTKLIDESGKEITKKSYNYIGSFHEERAAFSTTDKKGNWKYGYLDREGNEIIDNKYEYANAFKDGKAVVKLSDSNFALIGLNGEILYTYKYAFVGNHSEGLLPFQKTSGGRSGFIDESGQIIISPKYTFAEPFSNERSVVNISKDYTNKFGLIDKKGNYIFEPIYNSLNLLDHNRAAVGKAVNQEKPYLGSKYAVSDTDGNFLTDFIYYDISNYKKDLASAYDSTSTFFIDKSGKVMETLPKVEGKGFLSMEGNIIKAKVDYRISYLDKAGKVIWAQNTIIPLKKDYNVEEEKYKPNKDYLVYYPQIKGIKPLDVQKNVNNKLKELSQVKNISNKVQLDYNYLGDFQIEFFKKNLLVLKLLGYKYFFGAAHGMPTEIYPHINLTNGKFYSLKNLFKKKSNYVKVLSDIIEEQIKNNDEYSYVWLDSYKGIKKDQPFYVKEDALYIYFTPYEIAPYAAGFPTFKIPYSDIMNIINTKGNFWRSFN